MNDSIWSDIKKLLGRWLEENGLEYYFPKEESWVFLHPSIFNKKGELGMKGWDKKKFLDATGAKDMVEELWFNGTYRTVEIEKEWEAFSVKSRGRRRRYREEYLLFLHWKIDYPEGE